ncbi:cobalamin-dependent protein [candidate division KSB1 bacterium]|nr:cobalamin-dependent protein [candidate division KSB1 bacterium]
MKNILLVEPAYKNPYPPLGLMKISTWHKRKGNNVQLIKDTPHSPSLDLFEENEICYKKLKNHYDIIYITSLFTYQAQFVIETIRYYIDKFPKARTRVGGIMATLIPEYIKEKTGIETHVGLLRGAENCPPDYSWYPNLNYSISFTTRGCPRNCPFCAVGKHEPIFKVKENWPEDIDITKRKIIFWDNNWLASPNFEKDVKRLMKFRKIGITQVDFNQGLDCRLFDEDKIKLLSQIKIKPLRLAFDNCSEDGYIQKAIQLSQKYGFKDISVYVLYNSEDKNDTPEYFYYRINEINKLGALTYPMRYRALYNANGQYISDKWDKKLLRALKLSLMFYYTKGMITKSRDAFKKIYGNNGNEFKHKLYEIYEKDKRINSRLSRSNSRIKSDFVVP